jgi:hypothetical protein
MPGSRRGIATADLPGWKMIGAPFAALVKYELAAAHGIVPEQKARDATAITMRGPREKTE